MMHSPKKNVYYLFFIGCVLLLCKCWRRHTKISQKQARFSVMTPSWTLVLRDGIDIKSEINSLTTKAGLGQLCNSTCMWKSLGFWQQRVTKTLRIIKNVCLHGDTHCEHLHTLYNRHFRSHPINLPRLSLLPTTPLCLTHFDMQTLTTGRRQKYPSTAWYYPAHCLNWSLQRGIYAFSSSNPYEFFNLK